MAHTFSFKFIARNDFAAVVDGTEVSFHTTAVAAENAAKNAVYDLAQHEARYTEQAAPVVAEAAAPVATINPANISRATVAAVLVDARRKVADNRKVATALAKAATELEASRWYFTGEILVIASRSTAGKKYRVTGATCECPAHGRTVCWHKVAHRLLMRAATIQPTQPAA